LSEADGDTIRERLTWLAQSKVGQAQVEQLEPLPGHAGLGYSFILRQGTEPPRKLVIRTIPDGVPAVGPADVARQAKIMRSMAAAGIPVPEIVWWDGDDPVFGRPYFVCAFVEGYKTPDDWRRITETDRRLGRRAMQALPRIHAADWRGLTAEWGAPQTLELEFARLLNLYDRPTVDASVGGRLAVLRRRLLERRPPDPAVGCVHGDFHWGNIIFGDDDVRAILDWELAFVGPILLDVGCICFYADPEAFSGDFSDRARRFGLTPDEILDAYQKGSGRRLPSEEVAWFRAFSAYRFGVISLFNLMLHQRGKRRDAMWETMALSVPQMAERGLEILAK